MSASCCHDCRDEDDPQRGNPAYRRVLWIVLAINAVMFAVEIGAGLAAGGALSQDKGQRKSDADRVNAATQVFTAAIMARDIEAMDKV